ncbi:MAG: hypothetical protein R3E31_22930 [Chloroflexota bacterium]
MGCSSLGRPPDSLGDDLAVYTLHQYPTLLENEWRERVYTAVLCDITADTPDAARFTNLYRAWEKQRPYQRGHDANPATITQLTP